MHEKNAPEPRVKGVSEKLFWPTHTSAIRIRNVERIAAVGRKIGGAAIVFALMLRYRIRKSLVAEFHACGYQVGRREKDDRCSAQRTPSPPTSAADQEGTSDLL